LTHEIKLDGHRLQVVLSAVERPSIPGGSASTSAYQA
jgi:hypothetical protein